MSGSWRIKCISCGSDYKTDNLPRTCKVCGKKVLIVEDMRKKDD